MALFDGLTGAWQFNKTGATQKDSGPNARSGSLVGSVSIAAGKFGNGATISAGAGNYFEVADDYRIRLSRLASSISFWMRALATTDGSVISKTGNSPFPCGFRFDSAGFYMTEGGINKYNLTPYVPVDGAYHHVVCTVTNQASIVYVDGVSRAASDATIGYFWLGEAQKWRFGAAETGFYGSGVLAANVMLDEVLIWSDRALSVGEVTTLYGAGSGPSLPQNGVFVDEIGDYWINQRAKGTTSKTVTRTLEYTTGTPVTIETKLINYTDLATVIDWTSASNVSINTGAKTASFDLAWPESSAYRRLLVRTKDVGGTVIETSVNTLGHVVTGAIFDGLGQSNLGRKFDIISNTTAATSGLAYGVNGNFWEPIYGDGIKALAEALTAGGIGVGIGFRKGAIGGTSSTDWLNMTAGQPYPLFLIMAAATGNDSEGCIFSQGEADMTGAISATTSYSNWLTLLSRLRTYFDRTPAQYQFFMEVTGRLNDGIATDATCAATRYKQVDFIRGNEEVYCGGTNVDLPLQGDNTHLTSAGNISSGRRFAHAILNARGLTAFRLDALRATAAVRIAPTIVRVYFNAPVTGTTGMLFTDNNWSSNLTVSSAAATANYIDYTFNATPGGNIKLRYQYGMFPTITAPIYNANQVPTGESIGNVLLPIREMDVLTQTPASEIGQSVAVNPVTSADSFNLLEHFRKQRR